MSLNMELQLGVNKNFYILDFNNDLFIKSSKLNGILKHNRLVHLIDVPTRVTTTSATLLDLIIMY